MPMLFSYRKISLPTCIFFGLLLIVLGVYDIITHKVTLGVFKIIIGLGAVVICIPALKKEIKKDSVPK